MDRKSVLHCQMRRIRYIWGMRVSYLPLMLMVGTVICGAQPAASGRTHVVERYREIIDAEHGSFEQEPPKQLQR